MTTVLLFTVTTDFENAGLANYLNKLLRGERKSDNVVNILFQSSDRKTASNSY